MFQQEARLQEVVQREGSTFGITRLLLNTIDFYYLVFVDNLKKESTLSKMRTPLKINSSKINHNKRNPINPSLEESFIYKYGELC